ncbi:UNVERIFIED_CONTAM: hypothetical protein Slati_2940200 [Sesamum latifolium]|uniref:FAD dependent oxidoreductase domain-containing protein n=1 Tax=Sesamum latifolium TaxID=2727402 RepID=A0AAW2VDK9_9LAMI
MRDMVMMFIQNPNPAFISSTWRNPTPLLSTQKKCRSWSPSFFLLSPLLLFLLLYAHHLSVLGAGFAGLSVAWNLLQHGSRESHLCVDIYDEVGIGGGASGVAGGLLHPYSPKGPYHHSTCLALLLLLAFSSFFGGAECWNETLNLLHIAEECSELYCQLQNRAIHEEAAQSLVPNLSVPLNLVFFMPEALNINAQSYLEGLYLACQNLANDMSTSGHVHRELHFHQESVQSLLDLAVFLPELSGKLPLRTCRGIITHLQLGDDIREEYPKHSPSILSDAWLAVHGARHMDLGSTWDWKSMNYSRNVTTDEASKAMEVLLPKASSVYPAIKNWTVTGAVGGLRAMPPLTADGSLPLLGCINDYVDGSQTCKYWLFTGLGARGLLFHGWLGKLLAQAVLSHDENLIPFELTSWKHKLHQ